MEVNRKELLAALKIVKPGIGITTLSQTSTFAFTEGRVITYNDTISISHPVTGIDVTGAIEADELYKYLTKVKKDTLDVGIKHDKEADTTFLVIDVDKSQAKFVIQPKIELPLDQFEQKVEWYRMSPNFVEGLKFVVGACSNQPVKGVLTCVHVKDDGSVEGSDGFRIAWFKLMQKLPFSSFLIQAKAVKELIKLEPVEYAKADNGWIHFNNDEGTMVSIRTINDEYVNTKPLLKIKGDGNIFPKAIAEILDRAAVFKYGEESVTVILKENRVIVKSKSATGSFKEAARMRYREEPIEFMVTPSLIKQILDKPSSFVITDTLIQFKDEKTNWKYVAALRKYT